MVIDGLDEPAVSSGGFIKIASRSGRPDAE